MIKYYLALRDFLYFYEGLSRGNYLKFTVNGLFLFFVIGFSLGSTFLMINEVKSLHLLLLLCFHSGVVFLFPSTSGQRQIRFVILLTVQNIHWINGYDNILAKNSLCLFTPCFIIFSLLRSHFVFTIPFRYYV